MNEKKLSLVPKVRRLVEFLRDLAQMRDKVVRDIVNYEDVRFLNSLPPVLSSNLNIDAGEEDVLLTVPQVKTTPAPPPPSSLAPYVLIEEISNSTIESPPFLAATPQSVLSSQDAVMWSANWKQWALADRLLEPQRDWYKLLSKIVRLLDGNSDEYEVVLGLGMMSLVANGFMTRHPLMTLNLAVKADPITGEMKVVLPGEQKIRLYDRKLLEGLDFFDKSRLAAWRQKLGEWEPKPLGDDAVQLLREWLVAITRAFPFDESWAPTQQVDDSLRLVFAPCLILRERDQSNLVEYFERMLAELQSEGAVAPLGLAQLVEAIEAEERLRWLEDDDATSSEVLGSDPLFPLPANPEQLAIINKLSRDSGVVVQGPPGTGKTHTIANLVSALVSQGQRVLVTSQKAQALRVLRDKMPLDVQALCISMTDVARGGSKELNQSVTSLSDKFNHFSSEIHIQRVGVLQDRRHSARRKISELKEQIRASREQELVVHGPVAEGYSGKRSDMAAKVRSHETEFGWFPLPLASDAPDRLALGTAELQELLGLLRMETPARVARVMQVLPRMESLPTPAVVEELCAKEALAKQVAVSGRTTWSSLLEKLSREQRAVLLSGFRASVLLLAKFEALREQSWLNRALSDCFNQSNLKLWRQVAADLAVMTEVQSRISSLGLNQVVCPELVTHGEQGLSARLAQLQELHNYLLQGGSLKRGLLKSGAERRVKDFLKLCQVNGLPIDTNDSVEKLLTFISADVLTRQVAERLKDVGVSYSEQPRLIPRVHELSGIQECIAGLVKLGEHLENCAGVLLSRGITVRPADADELTAAIQGLEVCELLDEHQAIEFELKQLQESIGLIAKKPNSAPELVELERSIRNRDAERFGIEFNKLALSFAEKEEQGRCEQLLSRLRDSHGPLAELLRSTKNEQVWTSRISVLGEIWAWAIASRFLDSLEGGDSEEAVQEKLRSAIQDLGDATGKLAAELGWGKCLAQMTAEQERALRTYQSNISSKGKGQGKWANKYERAAKQAMSRAREAVPAWIMPLSEVLDTIPPDQNSFDVVIVDEASQAGIEALFLLWLAPRIIVVGDEKQCAPATILRGGLQQVYDRLDELLKDVPEYLRLEFTPKSNLFSLLSTRYGSVVRLREHFRCMPEIIGWSSTQFYSDAPLVPLRQFGSDRLPPLRTTRVEGAYTDGSSSTLTNKVEAQEIIRQIQVCLLDPAYDDKTIGVIALQSSAQARLIDDLLSQSISQEEIGRRRIRVGVAPDFQGDERNIIFLSMVVAEDEKIVAMTQRDWQRRFNVAATRAEDQLWLFHSVSLASLKSQDLRKSLLEYLLSPPQVFGGVEHRDLHWDSEKRTPFGSKFEQRVFLKIRERGYYVRPQVEVNGRFIDLVVSGAKGQLAVECDGDFWHSSPGDQLADIERQVELERAGWRFVRIRESAFNRNPEVALLPLWDELERRGIRPGDLKASEADVVSDWRPIQVVDEEGLDGIEEADERAGYRRSVSPSSTRKGEVRQESGNFDTSYQHPFPSAPDFDQDDWEQILIRASISDNDREIIFMRLGLGKFAGHPHTSDNVASKLGIPPTEVLTIEARVESHLLGINFGEGNGAPGAK